MVGQFAAPLALRPRAFFLLLRALTKRQFSPIMYKRSLPVPRLNCLRLGRGSFRFNFLLELHASRVGSCCAFGKVGRSARGQSDQGYHWLSRCDPMTISRLSTGTLYTGSGPVIRCDQALYATCGAVARKTLQISWLSRVFVGRKSGRVIIKHFTKYVARSCRNES